MINYKKILTLLAGPVAFILIKSLTFEDLSYEGQTVLATTAWVAIWWITEAVELEVTSLLPILLLPLSQGLKIGEVTASYGHPYIFLFMGGFMIGLAIEKWLLHQRIAFTIIRLIGNSPKKVILGFMLATAFLSMWISNTATSIMMLPIALSVIGSENNNNLFSKHLLLGIAYSASIGGMATLIGTPPNIIFAGVMKDSLGVEIPFGEWMVFALPFSSFLIVVTWLYLTANIPSEMKGFTYHFKAPEALTTPQKRVAIVFALVALLWISRSFVIVKFIPQVNDTIIAIFGAVILFIIPSGQEKTYLMDWNTAKKLPWGVLLIFGAGLSIAKGFSSTDLTSWLANQFLTLNFIPIFLVLLIVVACINFLTEITSNTATASMILPLLITLATSLKVSPMTLLVGAVLASSCAFMLPVATPPNAVVFGSGRIKIGEMIKAGVWLNLFSIGVIFLFVWFVLPLLWEI
ncbi:SLC13 family permease [Rapidithrix thailandica]|uniref:SLC13 family permease n=1 Tax=Rapidithrix thailandica TaxID=413964 RepID=A0AAW9S225_9BACT